MPAFKHSTGFLVPTPLSFHSTTRKLAQTQLVNATLQAPPKRAAFGRAVTPPRRVTGHYELRRAGIPEQVITRDNTSESAFAAAIGLFTAAAVLTPLITRTSLEAPLAGLAGSLLAIWAVDTLALNSLLGRFISAGLQNRRKVAIHEAGHLVVGYLLGARVKGYSLASVRDVVNGMDSGVEIECSDRWTAAAVGLGGVAAELVEYGGCVGAEQDLKEVQKIVNEMGAGEGIVRWALLTGYRIVQEHRQAVEEVAAVMMRNGDLEECLQTVDSSVDMAKLAD